MTPDMEIPKVPKELVKKARKGKSSKLKQTLFIFVLVFVAVIFTRGDSGLVKIYRLNDKISTAQQEIVRLKIEAEDLNWEINKLKEDSAYIKLYAAEYYGYAKPDQTIIQFLPAAPDSSR